MIQHYFKVAFRHIMKHKTQSVFCILGLAIGFTCFALSVLWIRYEMTYDSFHKDIDRIYMLSREDENAILKRTFSTPMALGGYLQHAFPEIEETCHAYGYTMDYTRDDGEIIDMFHLTADWNFFKMFHVDIYKESGTFRNEDSNEVAITEDASKRFFGNEDPIGKEIDRYGKKRVVGAIVKGWSKHSNIPFDIISINHLSEEKNWTYLATTYVLLKKGTDIESFSKKLAAIEINNSGEPVISLEMTSMQSFRYCTYYQYTLDGAVKFTHIKYFALLGTLVIICALFNYLTLFISELHIRGREMALRKINGASNDSLFYMFSFEFMLVLFISLLTGMLIIEITMPYFRSFSGIDMYKTTLYAETAAYIVGIILVSFPLCLLPVYFFRKRTLYNSLSGTVRNKNRNLFRKSSVVLQLMISIGLIFCTIVIMKQLHFLNYSDGVQRENRASISVWTPIDKAKLHKFISELPLVTEILPMNYYSVIPDASRVFLEVGDWEDAPARNNTIQLSCVLADEKYIDFYEIKLLDGKMIDENSPLNHVLITETTARSFGWNNPIGKKYYTDNEEITVVGLVKDFHTGSPTVKMPNIVLTLPHAFEEILFRTDIIFKYEEGKWDECREIIDQYINTEFPASRLFIHNTYERYNTLLKSENILMKLLSIVSLICILIAVFGILSFVLLTSEQRRKEIAIRKVNGAVIGDILQIFLKEYMILLLISAVVALPIGYMVMKTWLETYTKQTEISFWIYACILLGALLIIVASIIQPVWKAANQNPAEIIKTE